MYRMLLRALGLDPNLGKYNAPVPIGQTPDGLDPQFERNYAVWQRISQQYSDHFQMDPPLLGTTDGTTSYYRWLEKDILASEDLLRYGNEKLNAKIAYHENSHRRQARKEKLMFLHPLREAEAEDAALRFSLTGEMADVPSVLEPHKTLAAFATNIPREAKFEQGLKASASDIKEILFGCWNCKKHLGAHTPECQIAQMQALPKDGSSTSAISTSRSL
jgi:hypothetical protein